ncbi:hypothetical protein BH24ACT24_BH24ACT24_01750 [soil metagenome]
MWLMAYAVMAVMVRIGLTPGGRGGRHRGAGATPSSFSAARRAAQSATGMKVGFGILGILLGGQTDSAT